MSRKYTDKDIVPTEVLANRLDELANAVTEGRASIEREFTMRIPAERDRDPDLVLSDASRRLIIQEKEIAELKASKSVVDGIYEDRVNDNLELCSALRAVYSLCGEDPEIEKIVHTAIKDHGISDC